MDENTLESFIDFCNDMEIVEEVHFDTLLTQPKLFFDHVTLYHFSAEKLSEIKPVTINIGNKLARPRKSSWWTSYDSQAGWVLMIALKRAYPEFKNIDFVWTVKESMVDGKMINVPFGVIRKSLLNKIPDFFNSFTVYRYTKSFKGSEIGLGTEYSVKEYTCDKVVIPDEVDAFNFNDIRKFLIFANDSEMNTYIKTWKSMRNDGVHLQELVCPDKPWLYYEYDDAQQKKTSYN